MSNNKQLITKFIIMKKELLFAVSLFTAIVSANAQTVTTADEFLNAINNGNGDVVITIPANTTIDVTPDGVVAPVVPETVTSITIQGEGISSVLVSKGTYDLSAVAELNSFKFNNLTLTRNDIEGDYSLAVKTSIKNITFDGCTINASRGVLRLRDNAALKIGNILFNNCLISNIGTYCVISGEKGTVTSLTVTNNTFYNFRSTDTKNLFTFKPAESGETEVRLTNFRMENNTLNKVVLGGSSASNYVADFGKVEGNAKAVAGEFVFRNNLLGEPISGTTKIFSKVPMSEDPNKDQCIIEGNFISSSWSTDANSDKYFTDGETKNVAPEVATLFPNAANNDFTIAKDQAYSNAGDPRWNNGTASISSAATIKAIVATEYYNVAGIKLATPAKGLNIVRNIMEDGSVEVVKAYIR